MRTIDFNHDKLEDYLNHLRADYACSGWSNKEFLYEVGRKYIHIIMQDNQRSSHSRVMLADDNKFKQGDILKSATWRGPARNFKRGNVLTGDYKNIR